MEPEGSLPHSQAPSTCPCPDPDQSGPYSPSHSFKIHFNITLPSTPGSSRWSLSLKSPPPYQNAVCTSPIFHTYHMPHPIHSSLFDRPISTHTHTHIHTCIYIYIHTHMYIHILLNARTEVAAWFSMHYLLTVTCRVWQMRGAYKDWFRRPEYKTQSEIPWTNTQENNIKMSLKETGRGCVDGIHLAQTSDVLFGIR